MSHPPLALDNSADSDRQPGSPAEICPPRSRLLHDPECQIDHSPWRQKQFVTAAIKHSGETDVRAISDFLFLILFFVLVGVWLVMWIVLHLAGGLIHLLLIIAVIALILHLVRGRSPA